MPTATDVIKLIDQAYERKSKFLDLGHLKITELPDRLKVLAPFLIGLSLGKYDKSQTSKYRRDSGRRKIVNQSDIADFLAQYLPDLQVLHINGNQLGDEGAKILSNLSKLHYLDVSNNQIGVPGAQALSQLKNLNTLNIRENKIWSGGAQAISELNELRILHISSNMIGPVGARAVSNLKKLHTLFIDDNQIRDGGAFSISELQGLHTLSISSNQITVDGIQGISRLKELRTLDVSNNQIDSNGIQSVEQLYKLQSLAISDNQIRDVGAESIGKLTELRTLDISSNQITQDGAYTIGQLQNLRTLLISNNKISDIGTLYISNLNALRILHISTNMIGPTGTQAINNLKKLHTLVADNNQIKDEGLEEVIKLNRLRNLNISANQITSEGTIKISKLSLLNVLDISSNDIGDVGATNISQLKNLCSLNVRSNRISGSGAKALSQIKGLNFLDIRHNLIIEFPIEAFRNIIISSIKTLYLEKNPIENLPISNLNDLGAIRSYILSTQIIDELTRNTYVKINLLGTGEVGKTEWTRFLSSKDYKAGQDRTHGIEHKLWEFKGLDEQTYTVSIWDFGGQEYYHGTHHLFLRKGHFYVVLWTKSTNYDQEVSKSDDYPYWLGNVRHFAPDSPLILIQNKCDKYSMQYPNSEVMLDYNISPENVSFISVEGAFKKEPKWSLLWQNMKSTLQYSIQEYAQRITLNQKWLKARKKINVAGIDEIYLNLEQFRILSSIDIDQEDGFISYLEFVGDALHFKEVELLKDKVFINPIELSRQIYQLFSWEIKEKQAGIFDRIYLENELGDKEKADVFLEVMKQFYLVFAEPGSDDRFVIPQYLPEYANSFKSTLLSLLPLAFELTYPDFLHEGLIFRFIAQYGIYAKDNTSYWKYGLLFIHPETQLSTIIYYIREKRKIKIHIEDKQGKSQVAQELFYYFAFRKLSGEAENSTTPNIDTTNNVVSQINTLNQNINFEQVEKTNLDWSTLYPRLVLSTDGIHSLRVKDAHDNVVNNIFFGHCITTHKRIKLNYMTQNLLSNPSSQNKLRVFFSYSHKDEAYRDELEKHFSPLKRSNLIETWHDRKITPGDNWDNAIKENLINADIVLLLLSADFLASDYIWENELDIIRQRLSDSYDKIKVVPIFLRSCDLSNFDQMAYQGLPNDKDWIISKNWPFPDDAYLAVATGLRKLLESASKQIQ